MTKQRIFYEYIDEEKWKKLNATLFGILVNHYVTEKHSLKTIIIIYLYWFLFLNNN